MALAVFLAESPTELTTSATDAVLAMECLVIMVCLRRAAPVNHWRTGLWCWVFGLLAFSAILGAVIHGFVLPSSTRAALWLPLYLSLGVLVALFMVGAIYDWLGVGVAFFGLTQFFSGGFGLFVVYEALVMVSALAIYLRLAATHRLKGAGVIAAAIVLNLLAAGLQASHVSVRLLFQFDHNGLYHLVQMIATATLGLGLGLGLGSPTRTDADYFS
jgi:hypothetical protein